MCWDSWHEWQERRKRDTWREEKTEAGLHCTVVFADSHSTQMSENAAKVHSWLNVINRVGESTRPVPFSVQLICIRTRNFASIDPFMPLK